MGDNWSDHVLFENPRSCRKVRKCCRGCYDAISQNEGSPLTVAKACRVKTMCNKYVGKAYFLLYLLRNNSRRSVCKVNT